MARIIRHRSAQAWRFAATALPLAALALAQAPAVGQQPPPAAAAAPANAAKPAATQEELDKLLAPIALYPDALIAQILMASTYPLEVVEAARWSKDNPNLKDKALEDALVQQSWDPSVKSLTSVPQVLKQMNENLSWTQQLGDAFLADQKAVLTTVQGLRAKANSAGNLKSTPEQTVKTETQGSQTVYVIESAKPETVYVPTYNPSTVYGTWPYPAPPYYMYPPGYVYAPGLTFAAGIFVGAAIWGNCNWGGNNVNVNVNNYNKFNKANINNGNWNHNVDHRKGVAYKDQGVADRYNRGANTQAAQSREQFRGRAEQGRQEMAGMDRSEMQNRVSQADRATAANRGAERGAAGGQAGVSDRQAGSAGGRDVSGSARGGGAAPSAGARDAGASSRGGGGGGFSGAGNSGASARQASSRGGSSFSGGGGGGGGRAGGGGGRGGRR